MTVVVTVLKDPRVRRTIESLLAQRRPPEEILVDDGGGTDEVRKIAEELGRRDDRIRYLLAPGNIAESRNAALEVATGEFVGFLDADEIAPPEWLERLLGAFGDPSVGFAGGPTPATPESLSNRTARFYDGYLRRFYDVVARSHPHALPMGNSLWRSETLRSVRPLATFGGARVGNEDHDAAVRAIRGGWTGVYVPDAWVGHDFSDLRLGSLWRKQRQYAAGGFHVWRRQGSTYEATPARLLPYALVPLLAALGAILLLPTPTRAVGLALLAFDGLFLGALAAYLTLTGLLQRHRYPGLEYGALEILRRWATLDGAARGAVAWLGRPGGAAPTDVRAAPPENLKREGPSARR
ncbi:MAG TPA: glycosyltransferase [Thermoplasmata archaeon]|nr:glycosyltransferase [Thermoplasmata archaeon]